LTPSPTIATGVPHLADGRHFVLRQQVGEDLVYARLGGNALGHTPVVAGQHDDPADAGGLQLAHHGRRVGAQLVGQGDEAEDDQGW
jgi:hypothetical protein